MFQCSLVSLVSPWAPTHNTHVSAAMTGNDGKKRTLSQSMSIYIGQPQEVVATYADEFMEIAINIW